jgi:hypothetical protein
LNTFPEALAALYGDKSLPDFGKLKKIGKLFILIS